MVNNISLLSFRHFADKSVCITFEDDTSCFTINTWMTLYFQMCPCFLPYPSSAPAWCWPFFWSCYSLFYKDIDSVGQVCWPVPSPPSETLFMFPAANWHLHWTPAVSLRDPYITHTHTYRNTHENRQVTLSQASVWACLYLQTHLQHTNTHISTCRPLHSYWHFVGCRYSGTNWLVRLLWCMKCLHTHWKLFLHLN